MPRWCQLDCSDERSEWTKQSMPSNSWSWFWSHKSNILNLDRCNRRGIRRLGLGFVVEERWIWDAESEERDAEVAIANSKVCKSRWRIRFWRRRWDLSERKRGKCELNWVFRQRRVTPYWKNYDFIDTKIKLRLCIYKSHQHTCSNNSTQKTKTNITN